MDFVRPYIDDIIIFSNNLTEHTRHVEMVLQRLADNHLIVSSKKCQWAQPKVIFLGHEVSHHTIAPLHS